MALELAARAKSFGLDRIDFFFAPSGKNQPAEEFLEREFCDYRCPLGSGVEYRIPVEHGLALRFSPTRRTNGASIVGTGGAAAPRDGEPNHLRATTLSWIASELFTGDAIWSTIQNSRRNENVNRECMSPRTSSERQIADIWADVLGLANVGVNDNFFQIGGDSLAMVRIILRVHELTDFELPIRAFFEAPTIEEQLLRFPIRERTGQ
jgi:acyl carrier protein